MRSFGILLLTFVVFLKSIDLSVAVLTNAMEAGSSSAPCPNPPDAPYLEHPTRPSMTHVPINVTLTYQQRASAINIPQHVLHPPPHIPPPNARRPVSRPTARPLLQHYNNSFNYQNHSQYSHGLEHNPYNQQYNAYNQQLNPYQNNAQQNYGHQHHAGQPNSPQTYNFYPNRTDAFDENLTNFPSINPGSGSYHGAVSTDLNLGNSFNNAQNQPRMNDRNNGFNLFPPNNTWQG